MHFLRRFLMMYRPSWYLDALFFWSIFLCGTIFILWLFNNTTKTQIRSSMERRIYSITQSTARLFDPKSISPKEPHRNYQDGDYLEKVSSLIRVVEGQNQEVSSIYLMALKDGKLMFFTDGFREWKELDPQTDLFEKYHLAVRRCLRSRSLYMSDWGFLNNQIFYFFTPLGSSQEFTVYPLSSLNHSSDSFNPVVVVVFDAEGMRSELTAVDANSSQVIFLSLILATIVSIVTRRRSIQREEAVEQRLAAMELLRHRDMILGAVVAAADQCIIERNLANPFAALLVESNKALEATSVFLKTVSGGERPSLGLGKNTVVGVCDPAYQHFDPAWLENPEWEQWKKELEGGRSVVGLVEQFSKEEKNLLEKTGLKSIALIPVRSEKRLVAVLVIEHHTEAVIWEVGLLDTLNLAARLFGSAITRHENEAHFRYSSKMEALGRMGSGVAHEFNNLLHIVSGNLAILASKLPDHPHLMKMVDGMLATTQRGSKIINQLLRATRQTEVDLKQGSLNEAIERTITLAQPTLPKGILLSANLDKSLPSVLLDDGLIQQVVLNLILNARDAIENEGEIKIQTGITTHPYLWDGKKYVFCRVRDTGAGIPEKILESIFDPFFTTKPQGQGTGLGLSTSRGILELHRGFIEAVNHSNGAAFTFYIPVESVQITEKEEETKVLPLSEFLPQGDKVLVGDDEEMCLSLVGDILAENHFEPILAHNGDELLQIAQEQRDEIQWVVTDWSMPGLSEVNLVKKLRLALPKAKIIVTSGFLLQENLPSECDGFIQKPFQADSLLALMKKIYSSSARK